MSEAALQQATAPSPSLRWLGALLSVALFLSGAVSGVLFKDVITPPPPPNPYGSLALTSEPTASAELAAILLRDDARALAAYIGDPDLLRNLGQAMQPVAEIFEVRFLGATEKNSDTLAGYSFTGRVGGIGTETVAVGIVFTVRDGKVIGVN